MFVMLNINADNMTTQIFKNYSDFLNRPDQKINGVSQDFATENPNYEKDNETNESCWNCRSCRSCSSCSSCSYCSDCSDCRSCSSCSSCSYCSYCSDCSYCRSCRSCSYCRSCRSCSSCSSCTKKTKNEGGAPAFEIPVIENIHTKVLEAIELDPQSFDMGGWHKKTACGTTHCRAGHVVHLAGEAGYLLESQTSTAFAAMQIYKASSDIKVSPNKFYGSNETALVDIKLCAKKEKAKSNKSAKK